MDRMKEFNASQRMSSNGRLQVARSCSEVKRA